MGIEIKEKYFNLITFLIILGAACGVLMAWAVHHFYFGKYERNFNHMSPEQAVYMRETRLRNLRSLAAMMGRRDIMREIDGGAYDDRSH